MWESRAGSKDGCVGPCRIEADATGRGCRSREWQYCPFPGHGVTGYDFICASCGLPANGQDEDSSPAEPSGAQPSAEHRAACRRVAPEAAARLLLLVQVCGTARDRRRGRSRVFPQTSMARHCSSVWGNGGQGHPQLRSLGHFDVDGCSGGGRGRGAWGE